MKKKKLFLLISIVTVLLVGVASVSYAATAYNSPAEIIAGLTGKSVDEAVADRQAGSSYGAQAKEAGKLTEFQTARLELYKQNLDQAVADKRISQEDADKLYEAMKLRIANCTGDGTGQGAGNGIGRGMGMGMGAGGRGMGRGAGGSGAGLGCGTCTGTTANP